jgi:hypothetical protein
MRSNFKQSCQAKCHTFKFATGLVFTYSFHDLTKLYCLRMVDLENLRTASLYINNQLLSRGLLRDRPSIDFANPGYDDAEIASTMGRILEVVNDLILRRDVSFFPPLQPKSESD